jgi:hypothetical protein
MGKEILGHITCPQCGNKKASVHQNAGRNSKALYYRCYPDDGEQCGTIQPSLSGGQNFIKKNMRPLNNIEQAEAADHAAENAKVEQIKVAEKVAKQSPEQKKKSSFAWLSEDSEA